MGVFDDLINVDEDGKLNYSNWIEWRHIPIGLIHCQQCLILDKCWFNDLLKPKIPQHEKCHCIAISVAKPVPNVNSNANCDIRKFKDYIFSDKYKWTGKCDLFEKLGFSIEDSDFLKSEYEKQALKNYCESNYKLSKLDAQGQRININIKFEKNGRKIVFISGWMVRPHGLITNNTPLAD